ncbi:MAG: cation:proton antiporter [Acidobacteria bacterium]|nr:cation:proton antiporter [Acidobacteriota bacterium]
MDEAGFLKDMVVVFGCAAIVVYLFQSLKQSPIVGFIITGTIIGPYGFSLIRDVESVRTLATVGLMILLFSLGLEYSLKKLMETRVAILVAGPLQMLITIAAVMAIARYFGASISASFVYGVLIGLSSTAILMKMIAELGAVNSMHGRIGLGICIFQDLITIPFMIAIPLMAAEKAQWEQIGFSIGKALLLIALVVVLARYIFPHVLRGILLTRSKELFLMSSIFLFLGIAWISAGVGISLALGSFLAGLVLSESEYGHHIFAEVRPFRDGLNSLFFISLGMLVNPAFIASNMGLILGTTAAIVVGKTIFTTFAVMASRIPLQTALLCGLALAQVGEFSFILLQAAASVGIVGSEPYQIFLACSVVSMVIAPALFGFSRKLIMRYAGNWNPRFALNRATDKELDEYEKYRDHVIICGFGLGGRNIASVLKANQIPYVIIDLNEQRVRECRKEGEPVIFGDCTNTHILEIAGIKRSRVIVFVISDPLGTRLAIEAARRLSRDIVVLTRTKYVTDMDMLWDQGSTEVIAEEFEASLELMTRILRVYNAPRSLVAAEIKSIRDQRFGIFRERRTTVPRMRLSNDLDVFTETWQAPASYFWNGTTIADTRLRAETGAMVLGIIRENHTLNNPDPGERIFSGDRIVLSGTKEQLNNAIHMLTNGKSA